MKRVVRLISYVICFILCIFSFASVTALETKFEGQEKLSFEQKIYSHATIEQEFDSSSVLVVMDRNTGGINKKHKEDFFGTFQKNSVIDLTQINGNVKNAEIDVENFRQIIKIELPTDNKENVLKVIKELEKIDGIKYAGPNYYEYPSEISNTAFIKNLNNTCADNENSPESVNPNDPSFESQWGLTKIQAPNAWDITCGSRSVRVGVIDTGIANHPDLNGNLTSGWDFYNNNSITNDDIVGHGTHVGGIIGAVGNNSTGVSGVCWNITLVPLQVVNSQGSFPIDNIIEAINYATNNNIPILNYSGGGYNYNFAYEQAIKNYPGLFICSTGNGTDHDNNPNTSNVPVDTDITPHYPSSFPLSNIISVANTTNNDTLSSSSNYGDTTVDLAAPGTGILSTYPTSLASSGYKSSSGTSMATPHVTGVAALMKSVNPNLTAIKIKKLIMNSVDIVPALSGRCRTDGRLNANKAVAAARNFQDTTTQIFVGDITGDARADIVIPWDNNYNRDFITIQGQSNGTLGNNIETNVSGKYKDDNVYKDMGHLIDVNGDGRDDYVVVWRNPNNGARTFYTYLAQANGTFQSPITSSHSSGMFIADTFGRDKGCFADVNGDGKADYVVVWKRDDGTRAFSIYLGNSSGTFSSFTSYYTTGVFIADSFGRDTGYFADINGDGRDDYTVVWKNASGKRAFSVYIATASGNYTSHTTYNSTNGVFIDDGTGRDTGVFADTNGDGKADYIVVWKTDSGTRSFSVSLGSADGSIQTAHTTYPSTGTFCADKTGSRDTGHFADVNGDERDDYIVVWRASNGTVYFSVSLGKANGGFDSNHLTSGLGLYTYEADPKTGLDTGTFTDINGDGKADYVHYYNNNGFLKLAVSLGRVDGTFTTAYTHTAGIYR